jgi:glycosyltransferase involved in cell wall biosynthesis
VKISVVIPTFNKVHLLERTLAALVGQHLPEGTDWEIVVVDDGSSDGTAAFLAGFAQEAPVPVTVVDPGGNVGRARARNRGASAARGRWILFLDDDIVAPPELVRAHLDLLEGDPGTGTIGYAVTDPELIDGPHFHYLDSRGVAKLSPGPAPGRFFVTQNAAVPREAFLAIGGFDEEFSSYGFEDMEVAFRLEDEAGIRFRALTTPVPVHVHHHTLDQYLAKKVECGRHSLPHLARLHPDRIREMQLESVVEVPGRSGPGPVGGLIRWLAGSRLGRRMAHLMAKWPSGPECRPVWPALYFRLMNFTVLACFRRGVLEGGDEK